MTISFHPAIQSFPEADMAMNNGVIRCNRLARILSKEGYPLIECEDGHEVYFDRDSMTKEVWSRLEVGSNFRCRQIDGDKGPYGVQVTLLDWYSQVPDFEAPTRFETTCRVSISGCC